MANKRRQPVTYRKFKANPVISEGLLPVAREGGDLERRVAQGFSNFANQMGAMADLERARSQSLAGSQEALQAGPERVAVAPGSRIEAPAEIKSLITRVAQEEGMDPETLLTFAGIESSFNPNARNEDSGAAGLFQFMPGTAKQYGLSNPLDPEASTRAAIRLMRDNAGVLRKALGREPTAGELYLAHQQGAGGASKLLRNPDTPAWKIVGRKAVELNGGTQDMSAQAFANQWIAKASPAGTVLSGRTNAPALKAGSGISSRAYNQSYEKVYLARLDQIRRDDQATIYEAYKDDPAMLQQALGELKTAHLNESVFPEIAADYIVSFDASAGRLVKQAEAEAEKRRQQEELAEFEARTADLEERKAQALAGLDPDIEGTEERLADVQASIDAHYEQAVARDLLSEGDASEARARSLRETSVAFHVAQAGPMPAAEVAEYREQLRKDYAAGELENVDGDAWAAIDGQLAKLEKDRVTEGTKALKDLRRQGDDLAKRVLEGEIIGNDEVSAIYLNMRKAPGGREAGLSALRRIRIAQALKDNPLGIVETNLAELVQREDGTIDTDDLAFARDLIERQKAAITSDPLALAERYGTVPPVGGIMNGLQAEGAARTIAARIDAAETVADHFGVAPKYFTGNEPREIANLIREDPDAGLGLVAGIVEAGGERAGDILRELRDVAPEAEYAGAVLALGGSPRAAQDAILGSIPGPDGKAPEKPVTKQRRAISGDVMGGALSQLHPEDIGRIEAGAMSIAARRAQVAGVAKDSAEAEDIYRQALNEAAGAVAGIDGQLGGFGEVNGETILLPPGMSETQVEDVLELLIDEDLDTVGAPLSPLAEFGVTISADDIRDGRLLAVAPGVYRVARERAGRLEFVTDPQGGFWEMDIKALQAAVRTRPVPFGQPGRPHPWSLPERVRK